MIDGQIVRKTDVQTDTDKSICGYRGDHGGGGGPDSPVPPGK